MSIVPRDAMVAFEEDLKAMEGGILPQYLANEAPPPEMPFDKTRDHWWMRAQLPSGVFCWVAGVGSTRTYGHYRDDASEGLK